MYSISQPDQTGEEIRKGIRCHIKKQTEVYSTTIIKLSLCLIKHNVWESCVTASRLPKLRSRWKKGATFISQNFYVILGNGNGTPIPIIWEFRWAQSMSRGFGEEKNERKISNRDAFLLMG